MSSGTDDTGAFVTAFSELLIGNYAALSTAGLFIYECVITFGDEVNLFWMRPFTGATALFTSNRLLVLVYHFYILITAFIPLSEQVRRLFHASHSERLTDYRLPQSCSDIAIASYILDVLQYFPWAAFSAMRTYALSRRWPLSVFVFLLAIAPVGINLANFDFHVGGVIIPGIGCSASDSSTVETARRCE
ncbi:hypothetical protein L226DRAFT_575270 [Lentinus tigrinus ALCF2SS1-7]|uniref:uncharacterized protein n=1 Tax=Lentinus tigrinus ALCF2SS1-7 TaxID=1328758 RepID=UPI0011663CA5|nr:hypothetical protein L226DRAFT_575270 [Lentinus tigrinus ALCF2SS1-7]